MDLKNNDIIFIQKHKNQVETKPKKIILIGIGSVCIGFSLYFIHLYYPRFMLNTTSKHTGFLLALILGGLFAIVAGIIKIIISKK